MFNVIFYYMAVNLSYNHIKVCVSVLIFHIIAIIDNKIKVIFFFYLKR